jgi:hypothetical protein
MKIIDHGKWLPYKPPKDNWPENAPLNALFAKRESDGKDWYEHVNNPESFQPDTVKVGFMFHDFEQEWIIGPASTDPTLIFPANMYVREIDGFGSVDEDEIIAAFRNKVIDVATNAMRDRPIAPQLTPEQLMATHPNTILDLIERVKKLEERLK